VANNTFFCGVTYSEHILNFDFTGTLRVQLPHRVCPTIRKLSVAVNEKTSATWPISQCCGMHETRDYDAIHAEGNNHTKAFPISPRVHCGRLLSSPFTAGFWNIRAILRNLLREFPFYPTLEYVEIAKKNPKCKKASGDSLWTDMMQMLNNKSFIYDDPWTNNQYSCHYDVIHIVLTIDKIIFLKDWWKRNSILQH